MERIHATTVALDGNAILLKGPSGCGKSDLALRLIDEAAVLVADDYTEVSKIDGTLCCSAPDAIRGRMEIRGIGLRSVPAIDHVPLRLVVELVALDDIERLPDPAFEYIEGVAVPVFHMNAFAASTPAKIRFLLKDAKNLGKP